MAYRTFAAIDVGAYELEMKIFELTKVNGMKEIDCIRHRLELGKETYTAGKISAANVEKLCVVLRSFLEILKSYGVENYRVCATSAIRETGNRVILLDYIEKKTGIRIEVLSNSEQRFLDYKSIASRETEFNKIIQKGTAIIDAGSGSIQLSLFDKDSLVTTQNVKIGSLRIREKLAGLERNVIDMEELVAELVNHDLESFKKMFLKEREVRNLIIVGDSIGELTKKTAVSREEFLRVYHQIVNCTIDEVVERFEVASENISLLIPSLIIHKRFIEAFGIEMIWMPGLDLCDGIAYEYAQRNKVIKMGHDFDEDIIASARNIAKRYMCSKNHIKAVEELALTIFDKTKKLHRLTKRERLLLQISVILHGCGKYISLSDAAECSYHIIMATEIIGVSKSEREIIANVVRFNTGEVANYEMFSSGSGLHRKEYLIIAKLTAILRIANALDRSHKQKFKEVRMLLKEDELVITVENMTDITLEQGLFPEKAAFFEEVFNVRPVIKQKKSV